MADQVKPIPDGYHAVTPYLTIDNGAALVEFLKSAFGATVVHRMDHPDGTLWHADVRIADSHVMIGGASGESPAKVSQIYLYVEDADATYQRALAAGASSIMPPTDMFYGDRHGGVAPSRAPRRRRRHAAAVPRARRSRCGWRSTSCCPRDQGRSRDAGPAGLFAGGIQ